MVTSQELKILYNNIFNWLEKKSFEGYDPYDGANSKYSILKSNKLFRLFLVYFNKFSPINLRLLLGIEERQNLHAISLIIQALLKFKVDSDNINKILKEKIDYIISKSLYDKYGYHCWNGNDMYIQTKSEYQTPFIPGVIGTEACANAIFTYYKENQNQTHLKDILISVRDFFLKELFQVYNDVCFIRYKPMTKSSIFIYNASIIAANYILKINNYFKIEEGNAIAKKCFHHVIKRQREDGSWIYGINLKSQQEDVQIDFHQGFILDCIGDYLDIFKNDSKVFKSYKKGVEFFRKKQFLSNGMGYYRFPRKFPANIQNQAQGIITLSNYANRINTDYEDVFRILKWTQNKMYNKRRCEFYFFKYRFFINKIPYLRWNQASMFFALSVLLNNLTESTE